MSTTIKNIYDYIDSIAPFETQCEWDNSGLLIGSMKRYVNKVVLSLDASLNTVKFAKKNDAQLIISHHPIIFHALKNITPDTSVYNCIKSNIDVLSCHTNFDIAYNGINTNLASILRLKNTKRIEGTFMTVGEIDKEVTIDVFVQFIKRTLKVEGIRYTTTDRMIKKVALIGGSAAEYVDLAMANADCFITGEAPHHILQYCYERNFPLIIAGHFETESESFKMLLPKLDDKFNDVEFLWAGDNNPVCTI